MKTLTLLLFSVLWIPFLGSTQVMFEIEAPSAMRGVYPCMEPTATLWSSPNLSTVGNWFTDTVTIANDGTTASACDSLLSTHQGTIAIFRRDTCLIGEQLLNVQNAGATGALVIDSVIGRPLRFGSDSLSSQVNIPFVIISKDEGDAIINAIESGDTVVVNMGNKQGQHPVDLGMYMDKTLWSSFAIYPYTGNMFVDTSFGVWVYNRGQQDVQNAQVEFWVATDTVVESQLSDSFNLIAGDSLFVPFNVHYTWNYYWIDFVDYGYHLHNLPLDSDTLDNHVQSRIYYREIISRTFLGNGVESTPADYYYTTNVTGEIHHGYRLKTTDIICWSFLNLRTEADYSTELTTFLSVLNNWQTHTYLEQAPLGDVGIGWYDYVGDNWIGMYYQSGFNLYDEDTSAITISNYNLTTPYRIGFTTDMYHDERRRQEPFHEIYMSEDGVLKTDFDPKLTQLFYIEASSSPSNCGWGIDELSSDAFQLFPNPASNSFELASELTVKSVRMVSLRGEAVELYFDTSTERYQFATTSGIYLIHIQDDQDRTFTKRLFVTN